MKRVIIEFDNKANRYTMKEATPGNAEVSEDILKEWHKHQKEGQNNQEADRRWQDVLGQLYRKDGQ